MNYIWDLLIKAEKEGIQKAKINFKPAESFSPYMELSLPDMNISTLTDELDVEVNPYYRFYEIFKDLFHADYQESEELRRTLFDILIHFLAFVDRKQGLCKYEYYKKFIMEDIQKDVFGSRVKECFSLLDDEEIIIFLDGIITQYRCGSSVFLLKRIMKKIFPKNIIYINCQDKMEILMYLASKKREKVKAKIDFILDMFLPIGYEVLLYWDKHFGILGVDETMSQDNIILY